MTPLLLDALAKKLQADFGLHPVTASEIEFYVIGALTDMQAFWHDVSNAGMPLFNFGKEDGPEQFEVSLPPTDPLQTARDTLTLKNIISDVAKSHKMQASFSAKPFADRPGSGLHIHIHLNDSNGKNVYYKDDGFISDTLKYSIGGLLAWLPDSMAIFAPHADSYQRFTEKNNAPTTVSWGANNRTVAIRLPMAAHANKHIEHRVSGADADPAAVMAVMLAAIHYGLKNQCDPGAQIYGDASLPMYQLPGLPASLAEAKKLFESSDKIKAYF